MKVKVILGVLAAGVASYFVMATSTDQVAAGKEQHVPVTICHATGAAGHWVRQTIDDDAVIRQGHHTHQGGRDIIPPFVSTDGTVFQGLNWNTVGQATWNNGCAAPLVALAAVSTTEPTCDVSARLVYGAILNASFSGTPDGTFGPGNYTVTATSNSNALFDGATTEVEFSGVLADKLGYQTVDPEAACYKTPVAPEEPEAPVTPELPVESTDVVDSPAAQKTMMLPNTSGSSAGLMTLGAVTVTGIILAIGTAVKSRLLS